MLLSAWLMSPLVPLTLTSSGGGTGLRMESFHSVAEVEGGATLIEGGGSADRCRDRCRDRGQSWSRASRLQGYGSYRIAFTSVTCEGGKNGVAVPDLHMLVSYKESACGAVSSGEVGRR